MKRTNDILNALAFNAAILAAVLALKFDKGEPMMKNWKTTLAGILAAIGAPLAATGEGWVKVVGVLLTTIGTGALGIHAADNSSK